MTKDILAKQVLLCHNAIVIVTFFQWQEKIQQCTQGNLLFVINMCNLMQRMQRIIRNHHLFHIQVSTLLIILANDDKLSQGWLEKYNNLHLDCEDHHGEKWNDSYHISKLNFDEHDEINFPRACVCTSSKNYLVLKFFFMFWIKTEWPFIKTLRFTWYWYYCPPVLIGTLTMPKIRQLKVKWF